MFLLAPVVLPANWTRLALQVGPEPARGSDSDSDNDSGLSDRFSTKLTISSSTVNDDLALLSGMIRDAARLDAGVKGTDPTAHAIELHFTAHKTSSLDVYDSFADWLEDLSSFVKERVAAARPRQAVPPPDSSRPAYARDTPLTGMGTTPSGSAAWRQAVVPTARQPSLQVPPTNPTDAPRLSLWDNFYSPPQDQRASRPSATWPSARNRIREICHNYDDSD